MSLPRLTEGTSVQCRRMKRGFPSGRACGRSPSTTSSAEALRFAAPRVAMQAQLQRRPPSGAIDVSTWEIFSSWPCILPRHRLSFPQFPWTLVCPVLTAVHHLLGFLRIEICDVPAKRRRLSLDPGVHVKVETAAHDNLNRRAHNCNTV